MDKYSVYVGMDVHARSITARALNKNTGEIYKKNFGAGYSAIDIFEWIKNISSDDNSSAYCAYESGCTGVWLARDLRELGIDCDVIAISTLARSTKDKQSKCDKLDAKAILREIVNPLSSYSRVFIPTPTQEGERTLCRLYMQAKREAIRAKQHLSSFLMQIGYVWNEKTKTGRRKKPTGRAYEAWLSSLSFDNEEMRMSFDILRRKKDSAQAELKLMKEEIERLAKKTENLSYIDALCRLKGIDILSAMVIKAEFCDFERFVSGRKVSSWLGTIPSNNSSGEKDAHGHITKAGNKYLRRTLVEGVCAIATWKHPNKTPDTSNCRIKDIEPIARSANLRLFERYRHLTKERNINTNSAKVAIVNELVRWCWVIGRHVQQHQRLHLNC